MDDRAEWELEKELEQHTQEQRESSVAIDDALAIDPTNEELLQMKEELKAAIKAAEHSLFQLKRARLLQEVDAMTRASEVAAPSSHAGETQSLKPDGREPEQQQEQEQELPFSIGSNCRFRHTNGSWYNGKIFSVDDESGLARVSFLSPTAENMQICRFYLQQRCRFGGNCRQSHGVEFPIHALQPFIPPQWQDVPLGSTVLAVDVYEGLGLWKPAELESLDEVNQRAVVVFVSNGQKADVDDDQLALPEQAESSETSETSSAEEEEQEVVDAPGGLGMGLLVAGPQTETVTFAKWEKHTRGMASKMMASMGFHEGMGLGKSGQGQVAPIEVKVLPPKQSLGYVNEKKRTVVDENENEVNGAAKKKIRGGKRKRQKKWAAAALAAKVEQDRAPDVFGFINQQLAGQFDTQSRVPDDRRDNKVEALRKKEGSERKAKKEDRRSIVAHEDEMMEIRSKIGKLEEMARRNQKEKVVFDSVTRKLQEARKALSKAEAAHATATNAINSKEKEKKWLRF